MVLSKLVKSPAEAQKHREGHVNYLTSLKSEDKLEFGYRFVDGTGGFYVLRAFSIPDARKLADKDPYHLSGAREYSMFESERRF